MIVLVSEGNRIIVIANERETIPLAIIGMADFVSKGDKVVKNRWS